MASCGFLAIRRTTDEFVTEQQPWSLDGRLWITADARVDGRDELLAKLKAKVGVPLDGVPDVQLILHLCTASGARGASSTRSAISIAIWDASERRLFCARDHFGVKPFYWRTLFP